MNQQIIHTSTKEKIIELLKLHSLTVQAVKNMGFKLYIRHERNVRDEINPIYASLSEIRQHNLQDLIKPRGGTTIAEIIDPETEIVIVQRSECSLKDTYVRSVGINYALRRALRDLYARIIHKEESPNSE